MIRKLFSQISRSSKGQAAIEFLTTYGWMFMIVLVVSGGLVYFGFTGGKDNIPSSCRFDSIFECKSYFAHESGDYAVHKREDKFLCWWGADVEICHQL